MGLLCIVKKGWDREHGDKWDKRDAYVMGGNGLDGEHDGDEDMRVMELDGMELDGM